MSLYARDLIRKIVEETGSDECHYCRRKTRIQYTGGPKEPDHATIDHKIPKSKGGTRARENIVLACNACNGAKGSRSYEDFIARPYRLTRSRKQKTIAAKEKNVHPAYKVRRGTLAHAILAGEVTEDFRYVGTPTSQLKTEPRNRIVANPYHETMWVLTGKRVPKRQEIFDQT